MQDYLNSTRRSISAFKKAADDNRLKLKPAFQRNPVWTDAQKSYLIDSILRGYPIPELYVQESTDAKGNEVFTIVDGQQRIRACLEFLEGSLSLTPDEAPDWADFTFDDLSDTDKQKLWGYNFIVRQLPDVGDNELRAIFRRLNRNVVALNQQELRHATYWGKFINCVEKISDYDQWSEIGIFTANDIRRMIDVEYISELVIAYLHGLQNKKSQLDKWYATYEKSFPDQAKVESCFHDVLGELGQILPNINKTRWRKKSDFYTLFLIFANHRSSLPLTKTKRAQAAKKLIAFGEEIDSFISTKAQASAAAKSYTGAVERAASDLANRQQRQQQLEKVLSGIF
ncbi:DUF262 domain-containing protein [Burkholderia cepacia]|uniref:DUF262 domain-containing protein n=1 Tax=Burkholderia cepacia TaxID=292 RepID=UPI0015891787|nr:DUF262 domain-containing protein [Burkholderia cepacia]